MGKNMIEYVQCHTQMDLKTRPLPHRPLHARTSNDDYDGGLFFMMNIDRPLDLRYILMR